ncbi:hypothetical protein JCM10449v2_000907 [Rhodotorula kratochvilovae]
MGKKRSITPELDLTHDDPSSSESDASPPPARASSSRAKTQKRPRARSPEPDKPVHVRMAEASSFLAPRSRLFGGRGTGLEERAPVRLDGEGGGVDGKGKGRAREEDEPGYKDRPDGVLPFALLASQAGGSQPHPVEFDEATLLVTTKVKEKRGRKSNKKKKKKKGAASSEEESEDDRTDSDDSDDDDRVDIDSIVGRDAGATTVRALVAAPSFQMPWIANRFARMHLPKARDPDAPSPRKRKKKVKELDSDEDKKPKKPQMTRLFNKNGTVPLLLPDVELGGDKTGSMHASVFVVTRRTPPSKRHHLRLAICTADGAEGSWKKPENALWVQDFAQLDSPVKDPAANPTHTPFSHAFLEFLSAPELGLALKAKYRAHLAAFGAFDFTASDDVRLVTSLAGSFVGVEALAHAGGLDSLAKAMQGLAANRRGKWRIEYLTATTDRLPQRFLEQLHAAAQGVPPHEYKLQAMAGARAAERSWRNAAEQGGKVVVAYPAQDELERAAGKSKEDQYHVHWEGRAWGNLGGGDMRKRVLRQAVMKSGRLGHANMMLMLRAPFDADKVDDGSHPEQYEAFLLVGSHTPTLSSWGAYDFSSPSAPKVTLAQHDLSVVYRCAAAPSWKALLKRVDEVVPYERPLKPFEEGDEPAPTAPPRPPKKKAGRKKKAEAEVSD